MEKVGPGRVVLLVDDDVVLRNLIRHILQNAGFVVLPASHGVEALALLEANPAPIQLMISDVDMPFMDGIQLVAHMKQHRPATRVLLISGQAHEEVEKLGLPFLMKPFTPADLLIFIDELLGAD